MYRKVRNIWLFLSYEQFSKGKDYEYLSFKIRS